MNETELTDDASRDHEWVSTTVDEIRQEKRDRFKDFEREFPKCFGVVALLAAALVIGIWLSGPAKLEPKPTQRSLTSAETAQLAAIHVRYEELEKERAKRLQEVNAEYDLMERKQWRGTVWETEDLSPYQ